MPTNPSPGSVRPSAVVNEEIRALIRSCGGWLYGDARTRYERLVEEWTLAVAAERRIEVVKAA
ncbi:hypothetical protein [Streptomyces bluensis]|uniref:Uncharacterized protein n=1 Tax=Streptomyces bluensis TaxID=33897 RepID=A0ABW6UKT3_9ACTN